MGGIVEFVSGVVTAGHARLREPPTMTPADREPLLAVLQRAQHVERLSLAGPSLNFVPETALMASAFTARACWYLVHRGDANAEVERTLALPPQPRTAAEHFTGDVMYRFLPVVHRRARALDPRDVLTTRLQEHFLRWPLSGVLSDLDDGPVEPVDFAGHRGLALLYAERLAVNPRRGWVVQGEVREFIELVFAERDIRGLL